MSLAFLLSGLLEFGAGTITLVSGLAGRDAFWLYPNIGLSDPHGMLASNVGSSALATFGGITYIMAYFMKPTETAAILPLSAGAAGYHVLLALLALKSFTDGSLVPTVHASASDASKNFMRAVVTALHGTFGVWFVRNTLAAYKKHEANKKK